MVANQLGVQETLDAEVLGLRVRSVERTPDKFTYVHQPKDLPSTPWTDKISGKKGWTCLCPLIAIRGNLSRRSAPMRHAHGHAYYSIGVQYCQ